MLFRSTSSTSTTSTASTSTTSTSAGPLTASFSVPSGVNDWWVEVAVSANQPLAKVEAQVNGGTWTALAKQSWGTWAKSFYVPAGSKVVFRATSTTGATATSGTYTWLSGSTSTTTTSSGTTSTTFKATFTPKAIGNDWWVEVAVSANQPLSKVEVSINGGAWTGLTLQSWGNWAKSVYVPNSAKVVFRATSTTGATATSGATVWT